MLGCSGGQGVVPLPATPSPTPIVVHKEPKAPDDVTEELVNGIKVFRGTDWSINVPATFERKQTKNKDNALLFAAFDQTEQRLVMLVRGEVKNQTLAQFSGQIKSNIHESGMTLISESDGVINSIPFHKIESFKPPLTINTYILVNKELGFVLACGGLMTNAVSNSEKCDQIAYSLEIK